ncbi:hypothetical protein MBBAR_10c00270 [Methanobrevibacter arboriphilus JCM 13429 = DSM 1125]|uniref:Uncharacterized protein n=1 Tax=Methanobrevibacter arboriphilus JCM 13429 = DSM 1125 TaxID=1300164 RepID=A0A1V6N2F7_METAZ|nr:hypothetical protein [Methanobrevibacter arboriphilus]OQD58686.1 hypothetical protein MBBAR_10c00270 [Methanobrevibacter arboriphilus JCM 13429 = DSM 1125]
MEAKIKLSYNISDFEKKEIFLCFEATSGEHIIELTEEEHNEIVQDPPVPLKLDDDGKIIVDETRLRIAEIYKDLELSKWVIDEVNEYHANQEEVPSELMDILAQRKTLKEELIELEN